MAPSSRSWLAPTGRLPPRASRSMSATACSRVNWLDPLSLRFPARKNNQHHARAHNQKANGARDNDHLLSFGRDFERPRVGDLFLAAVSDLWRHEQYEAEQNQQDANNPHPQSLCAFHACMLSE